MTATTDLSTEVATLTTQVEKLRAEQLRASAVAEAAEADYRRALDKLVEEFGVESLDEARSLLAQLDAEVESGVAEIRRQLAIANGSES